ncbi:MAG: hypothetical protein WKF60_05780, partial [Ilumatobacter sp.]
MRISVDMCVAGRDLTEPKPSPDASIVAFVARWGDAVGIITVPAKGGPERVVTTEPPPAPGRGLGGGCFDWMPDGSGIVYAARDGDLWLQPIPGGPATRISDVPDGRRAVAPAITPDGRFVVAVVDEGELWMWRLDEPSPGERLDDGAADFVFDPSVTPCGTSVLWTAWNVPDMPWDAARVGVLSFDGRQHESVVGTTSVHQPRAMPDGRRLTVRDDTGWLNVWLGDEPLVDEEFEHAGPTWGMGQRSYAASPDGDRIAFARNEHGFGRLCVVDVATRTVSE